MIQVELQCQNNTKWSLGIYAIPERDSYRIDLVNLIETLNVYYLDKETLINFLQIINGNAYSNFGNDIDENVSYNGTLLKFIGYTKGPYFITRKVYFTKEELQKLRKKIAPILLEYSITNELNI